MGGIRNIEEHEQHSAEQHRNNSEEHNNNNHDDDDVDDDIINFGDEHLDDDMEGFKEVRKNVVKDRRKRNEFEVFVGGLDRDVDERDLRDVFSEVGDITEVRLMKNPLTKKNKGFAFVRYATIEQCKRAVSELKHPVINGKQCGVAPSQDSDTLFIGNICRTWTDEILKEELIRYGIENFEDLTLVEDTKNEGMNRGFAFLDFSSRSAAVEACKRLQKRDVVFGTDRTARVSFADTFIEPDDEIMSQVRTVFIDGLPSSWEVDRIKDHLKRFGRIEKVELARHMPAAKRDDFGFVTFYTHEDAVGCIDGINDSEIVSGTKKMKVRARLSRPRQRGKSAKQARGGYPVRRVGGRDDDDSYRPRIENYKYAHHDERGSNPSRRIYDRDPLQYRDRRPAGDYGRREYFPPDSSYKPRVSSAYNIKREREGGESFGRAQNYSRSNNEKLNTYRETTYISDEYLEDSPRRGGGARIAARRVSPIYEDDRYEYIEHSSSYPDKRDRDYSISRIKRPYSSMDEGHPRYGEPSIKQTRPRVAYVGSSGMAYTDNSYADDSSRPVHSSRSGYDGGKRSGGGSHGLYTRNLSSMGYRREEMSREDAEEMYSRYGRDHEHRGYITSRSEMATNDSYPPAYTNRRMNDDRLGGRDLGAYY
jgi:RNA recognition motif-containing protein